MPKKEVRAYLDEYTYDRVLEEEERTGKNKSQIVNERAREGYEKKEHTLEDSLLPTFGQALFIAGFVIAFYASMVSGLGVSALGGAMVIGSNVDAQLKNGADGYGEAIRRSIGV